ncbi:PIN domain-like protein [Chytriomyces sp. MP71]|nr:PIN domain-like protein [Chytriomyces sp. MP71]
MGISGLLPLLEPIKRNKHLRDYAGCTVAVDVYVWLHRAAFGCAMDLGLGKKTTAYVGFCLKRVALLRQFGVEPLLVFDGGCLPMKHHTENERRQKRKDARERAQEELRKGNATKAMELFQQCVNITPNMAHELIKTLQKEGIKYIVAPYEADAQLVFLEKIGKVHAVLTEDSDLLVFGCQRVLLKLEASGSVVEINAVDFAHVPCMKRGWTFTKFRQACILSGCDYLPSLKGVGIKKAFEAVGSSSSLERTLKTWRMFGYSIKAPKVRDGYEDAFKEAEFTFLYQRVYDPTLKRLVHLNDPAPEHVHMMESMARFLGRDLAPQIAEGVANGQLNPYSLKPYGSGDEGSFGMDDEEEILVPERVHVQLARPMSSPPPPPDLSKSARILQIATTSASNYSYDVSQSTSSLSRFFSSSSSSAPVEHDTVNAQLKSDKDEANVYQTVNTSPSHRQKITGSQSISHLSRFRSTEAVPSDVFSYHSLTVKPKLKSKPSPPRDVDNEIVPSLSQPDGLALGSLKSVAADLGYFCFEETNHIQCQEGKDIENEPEPTLSQLVLSGTVGYMDNPAYCVPYKAPALSLKTKSTVSSAFGAFRAPASTSGEASMYAVPLKKAKTTTGVSSAGQKKRLGAGRPSSLLPITAFFGRK